MIIILESFATEFVGALNGELKSYTPNLDSIANLGLSFPNSFANGKTSQEAISSILLSLPSMMENAFITSRYQHNSFKGLGSLLQQRGYQTAFFHGGNNGTMFFDTFSKACGFEKYFGRNEFNDETQHDGSWGIYDEPFFDYSADRISEFEQPFCTVLFSVSSHHPFTLPEKYANVFKGEIPIHESIAYTDMALGRFFKKASSKAWFNNTLFVLTADHSSEVTTSYSRSRAGMFSVPIILYAPGDQNIIGKRNVPVQHVDIIPTILDWLDYEGSYTSFGKSMLSEHGSRYAFNFLGDIYQLSSEKFLLLFDGSKVLAFYNKKEDPGLKNDLRNDNISEMARMLHHLQAVIQGYNHMLINNKWAGS
ncbi:MAG: LTA synthase family protein [Bacteroidetes bacterium]|nr:LTA synthase family protein [Bacteroidota bacterium]